MLARSFLIELSSKLLGTRTGIKAGSSSILGWIRPLLLELLALEWRKFHTFELIYLWSQLANLDQILCVASLGWGEGCIRFWGRLDQNFGFHGNRKPPLTYNGENDVSTFSRLLPHLSWRLTRWAYSIPMVHRPHIQTWISLRPVGQSWSNFICSITGGGKAA